MTIELVARTELIVTPGGEMDTAPALLRPVGDDTIRPMVLRAG